MIRMSITWLMTLRAFMSVAVFLIILFFPLNWAVASLSEEDWKSTFVVINEGRVQSDIDVSTDKDLPHALKALKNNVLVTKPPKLSNVIIAKEKNTINELLRANGIDRAIIVRVLEIEEASREQAGTTDGKQYLIRKKKPVYAIRVSLLDVQKGTVEEVYTAKVKKEQLKQVYKEIKASLDPYYETGKIVEVVDKKPEKKESAEKPRKLIHGYYSGGLLTIIPMRTYRKYSAYGIGGVLEGGIENPKINRNYFGCSIGIAKMDSKKSDISNYFVFPVSMNVSYLFPVRESLNIYPRLTCGYYCHHTTDGFFYDPQIGMEIRASYTIHNEGAVFVQCGYTRFFEKKYDGDALEVQCGYQAKFAW